MSVSTSLRRIDSSWMSWLCFIYSVCLLLGHNSSSSGLGVLAQTEEPMNAYAKGCLYEKLQNWTSMRVCNSYDPPNAAEKGICRLSDFQEEYLEIRIASGNWFSATALGWLTQIVLSEVLGVPSTMEAGGLEYSRDFYDAQGRVDYDQPARETMLQTARKLEDADCRNIPKKQGDDYVACAHFTPESWGNRDELIQSGDIEPTQGVGILGLETWWMTKFTAVEYPEFDSYHGLVPENRELLAELFKRPTTWIDYCDLVSTNNCSTADEVAQRAPADETEAQRMFVEGEYTGHFRHTDKNNCTMFPDNCTGHIANYPCGWNTNMEPITYHYDIPLDPNNGVDGAPGGYTQEQLMEMWAAANATRSHLMMMWWFPEPTVQHFAGSEAEFQRVVLPPYTYECATAWEKYQSNRDECSENITKRVGFPEEACEWPTEPLRKMITGNLADVTRASPDATRSPAYGMLRHFQVSELHLGQLFDFHESEPSPRDAVCKFAVENFDWVVSMIPAGNYPRVTRGESTDKLARAVLAVGCISTAFVLLTWFLLYRKRDKPSVLYAQLDFLYMLLGGALLVTVGSILTGFPASDALCVTNIWFVHLGYTLTLVPLCVKVSALNRMMTSAQSFRRFSVKKSTLRGAVAMVGLAVAIVLAVWSGVDPPQKIAEYNLSEDKVLPEGFTPDIEAFVVDKVYYCSAGESDAWAYAGLGWNTFLLVCASVLAFQMRNIKEDFNESRTLAFLIYSHAVFVVLRICTYLLTDHFEGSTLRQMRGLLHAFDQMAACVIYFLPKIFLPDLDGVMERSSLNFGAATNQSPNSGFRVSSNQSSKVSGSSLLLKLPDGTPPEEAAEEVSSNAITAVPTSSKMENGTSGEKIPSNLENGNPEHGEESSDKLENGTRESEQDETPSAEGAPSLEEPAAA